PSALSKVRRPVSMAPSPDVRPRRCSALGPDTLNVMGSDPPVWNSTSPELKYQSNTSATPSLASATKPSSDMDMIAMTFDIAMFLSRGEDCVQGIARSLRKVTTAPTITTPSATAEYDATQEISNNAPPATSIPPTALRNQTGYPQRRKAAVQEPSSSNFTQPILTHIHAK